MKNQKIVWFAFLMLSLATAGCGAGGGGGSTSSFVDVDTLDGTTLVPSERSVFRYTFSQSVDTSTVSTSTYFIVPVAESFMVSKTTTKAAYDNTVCNPADELNAIVDCPSNTVCTLAPTASLVAGMNYAVCLSPTITYASGSAFEGFTAFFDVESTKCDDTNIKKYAYLMAFHWCTDVAGSCDDPSNHKVSMAGSDDGINWTIIPEFAAISGSVPDIAFYDDFLYLFHTGTNSNWEKINACFEVVNSGNATIEGADSAGGFVDPSLIVSGDILNLFYLPGVLGADPAGCSTYPCTKAIHSAVEGDPKTASFVQQSGDRASLLLDGVTYKTFSDPDIIQRSDGTYILYVSIGQSVISYTSAELNDTFVISGGSATSAYISRESGGIPSALARSGGEVWLYVQYDIGGGASYIRRGVAKDGVALIEDANFSTVIDHTISSEFTTATDVGSPSIIEWPGTTWSKDQAPVK